MLQHSKSQTKKTSSKTKTTLTKTTLAQSGKTSTKKVSSRQRPTTPLLITPEQRRQMIEEAAYFIAEGQGFMEHASLDYWLAAEAEIDKQLSQKTM